MKNKIETTSGCTQQSDKIKSEVELLVEEIFDGNYNPDDMVIILTHIKMAKEARSLGVLADYMGQVYSLAPTAIQFL